MPSYVISVKATAPVRPRSGTSTSLSSFSNELTHGVCSISASAHDCPSVYRLVRDMMVTLGSGRRGRGGTSEGCGVGGRDCDWGWGVGGGAAGPREKGRGRGAKP